MSDTFFDQLGSIQLTKKYWMDSQKEKQYSCIGINIGLSQHIDSIFFVNDMNIYWQVITPKMHYDYLFYRIRQMKRPFKKWAKKNKDENIQLIQDAYNINRQRAIEYLAFLNEDQIEEIRKSQEKGTI